MRRRWISGLLAGLLALLWALPAGAESSRAFFAMDTAMIVRLTGDAGDGGLLDACEAEVRRLEGLLSVTDPNSEIARLNAAGAAALSGDTASLLRFALEMGRHTGWRLDITLYPVVRAWGFTTGEYRVPEDGEIAALLARVDGSRVELEGNEARLPDGAMVDLGAVAKGYASDRLAALLREGGVGSAVIDLGGNVYCVGAKPDGRAWRVGIRDPKDPSAFAGAVCVEDRAVVTSGCYERRFTAEDGTVYGHIFDPATGRPAESGLRSATVIGRSGAVCDALSTALFVAGAGDAAALLEGMGVEAVLVDDAGGLWITGGLRDAFTPMGAYASAKVHWIT